MAPGTSIVSKPLEPRWLALARHDIGIRERAGVANNPLLISRFAAVTKALGTAFNADSTPWCGAMMAWWMTQCGIKPPAIAIRAQSWATWGVPVGAAQLALGAVLVFSRAGGGHVALYAGEDVDHYVVLGGNQGDAVSIVRIPKTRCVARRWPAGEQLTGAPVRIGAGGIPITSGDA